MPPSPGGVAMAQMVAERSFISRLLFWCFGRVSIVKFIKENGNWCLHLNDWWIYSANKILVIDFNQVEDYYIENIKNTIYLVFYKNKAKFNPLLSYKCIFVDLKQKDIFLKFLKYKIYKKPELRDKFFDMANYLDDFNEISEKDFKIDDYTFPKY